MEDIGIILGVCVSMFVGALLGVNIYMDNCITPMDVYQGKTTLEYTVVDGVKVDSCVIWKKEE
jgi:imidazoleglycerol phosphate dehydratase HisB